MKRVSRSDDPEMRVLVKRNHILRRGPFLFSDYVEDQLSIATDDEGVGFYRARLATPSQQKGRTKTIIRQSENRLENKMKIVRKSEETKIRILSNKSVS